MDLTDIYQRKMSKLRVSLLETCNYRCLYCMPSHTRFPPISENLSTDEFIKISSNLVDLGLEEIRITGGEPTLYPHLDKIIDGFSRLPLRKLGLTTNAYNLLHYLPQLKDSNCQNINISIDSLKKENFEKITRRKGFERTMEAFEKACEENFKVKVNVVLMRGLNDDEILDFVEFSKKYDVDVRFLEIMKIGEACSWHPERYISMNETLLRIKKQYKVEPKIMPPDSTAVCYETSCGAKIGFIASESQPFCGDCSRLRLTPKGFLRSCLMSEKGMDLRNLSVEEYPTVLRNVISMKPNYRIEQQKEAMFKLGG